MSSAALLDVQKAKDNKGKTYYKYDILSRAGALCRACLLSLPTVPSEHVTVTFSHRVLAVCFLECNVQDIHVKDCSA